MKGKEKDKIVEWIREGKKYKECVELAKGEGITTDFHNSFYKWQQEVNPTQKVEVALESGKIRRVEREEKKTKDKRKVSWSKRKQDDADNSNLAKLINEGIFHASLPFCKSRQLKKEDVQEINVGGSAVACVLYFFPDIDLNHPALVLVTRIVFFYIKFRAICSTITEKVEAVKDKLSGLKSNWGEGK
jgi:regulator of replication initiation timing